jgi:hypothetical protein
VPKKLLGVSVLGGIRYKVFLGSEKDNPELAGRMYGVTMPHECEIWVNASDGPEARKDTWVHEHLHALLDAYGIKYTLRSQLGISGERWEAFEEELVRLLTPALRQTFDIKTPGSLK